MYLFEEKDSFGNRLVTIIFIVTTELYDDCYKHSKVFRFQIFTAGFIIF